MVGLGGVDVTRSSANEAGKEDQSKREIKQSEWMKVSAEWRCNKITPHPKGGKEVNKIR